MKMISCKNVIKEFGTPPVRILKSLSFDIPQGEFLSVTGRSGSGKSTLLYTISGLDSLSGGTVHIGGEEIHHFDEKRIHDFRNSFIGFVFQFHYLLPEITALDNVLMPARKMKQEKFKTEYALHLMEEFEIIKCRKKLPSQMSGGELQRTSLARSLIMEPKILFADEPTGNLDTENGERVMRIFEKTNSEMGTTIIMVTHEPDFAARAQRKIHLVDGIIESDEITTAGKKKKSGKKR